AGLLVAVLRFLTGDETALKRYFDRNRERRGFEALTEGFMALAAGEGNRAQTMASKAERLLAQPSLTRLINAEAAEKAGNRERAETYYKRMLEDDRTRFVGIQGLMRARLEAGETDTALKLAEKAFALRPKHEGTLKTLFALQSEKADWAGARKTLQATVRARALPRDVGNRREAVLAVANARAAMEAEETDKARTAVEEAVRLAPGLVPAATLAAELHIRAGDARKATQVLRRAWEEAPHPDLAAAFAAIAPDEGAEARLKRFQTLLRIKPGHPETAMLLAELELAAENFPGARKAIRDLAETQPTTRTLAIMAAIARGEGAEDEVVRGWLAKALSASRGDQWCCTNCRTVHGSWAPVCENCGAFDTMTWMRPPSGGEDTATAAAAMLPIVTETATAPATESAEPPA
ncbi:MAG: tetratricopeptide repeat protein, partial [Pseudomonadota bacterium]